jgi:hypothetical protein
VSAGLGILTLITALIAGSGAPGSARYDQVRQKSSHNSYQRDEPLLDQLVYHGLRSVELDLHDAKLGWPEFGGDWYVYHHALDPGSSCERLSECLDVLAAFRRAVPRHEVLTVWLDLKDDFGPDGSGHGPRDLDRLLREKFPEALFAPAELEASCPGARTPAEGVSARCGWPALSALEGRVLFVLTDGALVAFQDRFRTYQGASGAPAAFVAPEVSSREELDQHPDALFFNLPSSAAALAEEVHARGRVSRVFGLDAESWPIARSHHANHLATDAVNAEVEAWASVQDRRGSPFQCFGPCPDREREAEHIIGFQLGQPGPGPSSARAGALDTDPGDFYFAYEVEAPGRSGPRQWSALIATPSGGPEPDQASACLMARERSSAGGDYFAVCRDAASGALLVRARAAGQEPETSAVAPEIARAPFVRLLLERPSPNAPPGGPAECATGLASQDGLRWTRLGPPGCFPRPLGLQGLAAGSRARRAVRFLFGDVSRSDRAGYYAARSFFWLERLAEGAGGRWAETFDGLFR